MSRKKKNLNTYVFHLSAEENTLRQMPKFNGFACGHGAHKSKKSYDRNREKREFKQRLEHF